MGESESKIKSEVGRGELSTFRKIVESYKIPCLIIFIVHRGRIRKGHCFGKTWKKGCREAFYGQ